MMSPMNVVSVTTSLSSVLSTAFLSLGLASADEGSSIELTHTPTMFRVLSDRSDWVQERWVQGVKSSVWTRYYPPARSDLPTFVLVNGLTYEMDTWDALVKELRSYGVGLLLYDPVGQGKTLKFHGTPLAPVKIEDQAEDLRRVTEAYGLRSKLHLVGLSYGGGLIIAFLEKYSSRVENAFLLAPYTEPLRAQDQWIRSQIALVRFWFPYLNISEDELYRYFLRQIVYNTFPLYEPSILHPENKREAVVWLIDGIRKFDMYRAAKQVKYPNIHLVIAGADQYIPRAVLDYFWYQLPAEAQATRMYFRFSEHKIPEAMPETTARWLMNVWENKTYWIEQTRRYKYLEEWQIPKPKTQPLEGQARGLKTPSRTRSCQSLFH